MVEWLASLSSGSDGNAKVLFRLVLPDEVIQPLRTQADFSRRVLNGRFPRHQAVALPGCAVNHAIASPA
jgi:hypothetical protein